MWYNPFYSIVQFRVTTLRYRPKEAVPIEPKQQRHISTDGVKTTTGATGQPGAPAPKNKKKPKKRRSIIGMIFSFIGCMLCLCIMAASVGGVLLSMYIVQVTADDAETLDLDNQKNRQTSIVYDINGNEYASLSRNENRIWRELSAMPENLQNAVIAIEDKNFRTEPGINLKGTIGAALNAFTGNRIWGTNRGASTLEQQLIKNLTGDNEQDNMRKVREIFRALGLDNKYSKETILEAYLNTIPLTGIIHGMEAGSIEYFGKHVEDLTLAECATLASITKNPTKYNPATNPEELIKRRNHVLYEMYTQGYITEAEFNAAKAETVTLTEKTSTTENATRSSSNSWFTDALYTQLLNQLQEDLNYTADEAKELIFSGGLRIYSTVDPTVQAGIEKTMYNEDDLIPALWHEEPVCLRDYPADSSSWDEVQYDEATGLPIVSELMSEDRIPEFEEYVDVVQIGARNMQNFQLLKAVGKMHKPVLLKRGLCNTIEEWIMSAEYIMAGGNEQVILCERGIRTFEKYTRNTLDLSAVPIIHEKTHLPIIVDPSHATGKANLVEPMMIAAVAAGADGLEVEVHYDPRHAWSDGAQCLTPDAFAQAMAKCRQVAWAIGRDM